MEARFSTLEKVHQYKKVLDSREIAYTSWPEPPIDPTDFVVACDPYHDELCEQIAMAIEIVFPEE